MPKYFVELSARFYAEVEVEANDEDEAVDLACEEADLDVWHGSIEWDVDYVELLESPAVDIVDENQEKLF